jgi:hypothetical protein
LHDISDHGVRRSVWTAGAACLTVFTLQSTQARADDPLGFYVGGAVGQARVDASLPNADQFREDHSAFKIMAGLRPIPVLGAELEYVDFGHPGRF